MSTMPMIDDCLAAAITAGRVPGVIATVGNTDGVLYEGAFGTRNLETGTPMTSDTVVWLASMTKAITGAVAMQQVDRGRLSLDDPAGEVCPYLGEVQVLDGFTSDGEPILRPPKRAVTLRHLLTHSAGFAYEILERRLRDLYGAHRRAVDLRLRQRRVEDAAHLRSR